MEECAVQYIAWVFQGIRVSAASICPAEALISLISHHFNNGQLMSFSAKSKLAYACSAIVTPRISVLAMARAFSWTKLTIQLAIHPVILSRSRTRDIDPCKKVPK